MDWCDVILCEGREGREGLEGGVFLDGWSGFWVIFAASVCGVDAGFLRVW